MVSNLKHKKYMTIQEQYQKHCETPSDINEHLPVLKKYYDECEHVTEMGVRGSVSLHAALVSNAKKVIAYDILNVAVPDCEKLTFICADNLKVEIEETDFLFIDTAHNYIQLKQELALHSGKVKKYLGFHDTTIFGIHGDDGKEGLMKAINEFRASNENWQLEYHTNKNNGLTILKKV